MSTMWKPTVGQKLFAGVISVFLIFAVTFIIYQQNREKQYKIGVLNMRLQDFNSRMAEEIHDGTLTTEAAYAAYVARHHLAGLRVTLIRPTGEVIFDSRYKHYSRFTNHITRPEVVSALRNGSGSIVERNSKTLKGDFFYSATYYPRDSIIIRSALPYNHDLAISLRADLHFLWFALVAILLLVVILYHFMHRLGKNITKLRAFASKAGHNESLDTEDLADFPNDELGEIAGKIIKIYRQLQHTRREQDVLKRQLTQNIAHELKTPVASIQGYLETIISNPNVNDSLREQFLDRCYAQSQRLSALLQDISMLNKMDDGIPMVDFTDVDLVQLVNGVVKATALQLQDKQMTMTVRLPERLVIRGNASLIYSIFRNLTDNAIAYAGAGTAITLYAEETADQWRFVFSDNGVGVEPQHLGRLFERFYRVDKGRSRKMGGTGLGLAIVKNAVLAHGGSVSVSNGEQGGLRFDFTLNKH